MNERPRRLRKSEWVRNMVSEESPRISALIQPYFLATGPESEEKIAGFLGQNRLGVDLLSRKIEADLEHGLRNFLLFGSAEPIDKDREGRAGYRFDATTPCAIRTLRSRFGRAIVLFSDVCLCPYTDHGHCGILKEDVENDVSLEPLTKMALVHAQAGVDFVAPSDMMDGRVAAIRKTLDEEGFSSTGILAYTAKYASSFYGPFRSALGSAPASRSSYQMDFRNAEEALRELRLDIAEGADIVMIKPALNYLDVIRRVKDHSDVPVAAYSVSGEYQMIKLAVQAGMASEKDLVVETLTAIRRSGANVVVSYFASSCAKNGWLSHG